MVVAKPVAEWTKADIVRLVEEQRIEESRILDYKEALELETRSQRKEVCKDVSAMANAVGGVLIFGVAEERTADKKPTGRPDQIAPIYSEGLKEKLENILLNGIMPKCDVRIHAPIIIDDNDGYVLVIEIPKSATHVHMVGYGDNRNYIRRDFQSEPMTPEELRVAYEQIGASRSRALDMRESKLQPVPEDKLAEHIVAFPLVASERLFDPQEHEALSFARHNLPLLRQVETSFSRVAGGYEVRYGDNSLVELCRINHNGVLEHFTVFGGSDVPTMSVLWQCHDYLMFFGQTYQKIGYLGPVKIRYRLLSAKGTKLSSRNRGAWHDRKYTERLFQFEFETNPWQLRDDTLSLTQKVMDSLWIDYGFEGCPDIVDGKIVSRR